MSLKLGSGFKIADEVGRMSEETLRKAKNLHDILFKSNAPQGQSSRPVCRFRVVGSSTHAFVFQASSLHDKRKRENDNQSDSKKKKYDNAQKWDNVQCYECRQWGHFADKCPNKRKK